MGWDGVTARARRRIGVALHTTVVRGLGRPMGWDGITARARRRIGVALHTTQLSVGWVDPWVGSRFFSFRWVGLIAFSALTLLVGRQEAVGCWRGYLYEARYIQPS